MSEANEMTTEELEDFIERKLLEMLGDPDSGLQLRPDFELILRQRLERPSPRIAHEEVLKRFG